MSRVEGGADVGVLADGGFAFSTHRRMAASAVETADVSRRECAP
jgi:hypothetical protein